eukprot:TRINITY_DN3671_c0_g1_i2.p1 TRINITY_DN3671_c0_g1~~TRINITY_DN3671_c0_g1_i2.p1  ORF type:complete len:406 (-),score=127.91 TRINITY_DN3671_c0_g1_i2:41-1258(-)
MHAVAHRTSGNAGDRANWAKTPDQTHNMQLLTLITQLRTAVVQLPSIVKPGKPAQKGMDPEEVTQCAQEASTHIDTALKAIDALATGQILGPYLSAAAYALERVMGTMHKDSFANLEGGSAEQTSGASAYMLDLQSAVSLVQSEHLKTVAALNAPYAQEMLRCLADRLVRSFVSHAALVRPMEEAGKLKMARDMAMLEMCLSGIAPVATLGASYAELRAYRQLLFIDLDTTVKTGNTSSLLLQDPCVKQLRPTSVLHYLIGRCPFELSSPHQPTFGSSQQQQQRSKPPSSRSGGNPPVSSSGEEGSVGAYLDWLLRGNLKATGTSSSSSEGTGAGYLDTDVSYEAEAAAWGVVRQCVDRYHQRISAMQGGSGMQLRASAAVQLVESCGEPLLAMYKQHASGKGAP